MYSKLVNEYQTCMQYCASDTMQMVLICDIGIMFSCDQQLPVMLVCQHSVKFI